MELVKIERHSQKPRVYATCFERFRQRPGRYPVFNCRILGTEDALITITRSLKSGTSVSQATCTGNKIFWPALFPFH